MEWIKCSDRLPETEGRYLVCLRNFYVTEFNYSNYSKPRWFNLAAGDESMDNPIRFWMPLPEPPKE